MFSPRAWGWSVGVSPSDGEAKHRVELRYNLRGDASSYPHAPAPPAARPRRNCPARRSCRRRHGGGFCSERSRRKKVHAVHAGLKQNGCADAHSCRARYSMIPPPCPLENSPTRTLTPPYRALRLVPPRRLGVNASTAPEGILCSRTPACRPP